MILFLKKYNWFYLFLLILSSLYVLFLNNYYSIWLFMELNLLIFLTFISLNQNLVSDKLMKYYLLNGFSSLSFLFFINLNMIIFNNIYIYILNLLMFMKLGMFPFHLWFIEMLIDLSWMMCFYLSTWQKLIPMVLLNNFLLNNLLLIIGFIAGIFSIIMGLNQVLLKKLMGYSSLMHMVWMMLCLMINKVMFIFYYFGYMFLTYLIFKSFDEFNLDYLSDLFKNLYLNNLMYFFIFMLMSLGGLPPFFGFGMKVLMINYFLNYYLNYYFLFIMIILSVMFMYNYIRLFINFFLIFYFNINLNIIESLNLNFNKNFNFKFLIMFYSLSLFMLLYYLLIFF